MAVNFTTFVADTPCGALPLEIRSAIGAAYDAAERYSIGARLRTGGRYSIGVSPSLTRARGISAAWHLGRYACLLMDIFSPFCPRRGYRQVRGIASLQFQHTSSPAYIQIIKSTATGYTRVVFPMERQRAPNRDGHPCPLHLTAKQTAVPLLVPRVRTDLL